MSGDGFSEWGEYMAPKRRKLEEFSTSTMHMTIKRSELEEEFSPSRKESKSWDTLYLPNTTMEISENSNPNSKADRELCGIEKYKCLNFENHVGTDWNAIGRNAVDTLPADTNFLEKFYETIDWCIKQYLVDLRQSHDSEIEAPGAYIMHLQLDCFSVSVGLRRFPHLRRQPVALTQQADPGAREMSVTSENNRFFQMEQWNIPLSEIASCNYEARAKGVRNGMLLEQAIKLCPELNIIPYDFNGCKEVTKSLYDTIVPYTLKIEAVGCNEMYVDLSDVVREIHAPVMDIVAAIRSKVFAKTGCSCSAGVGANKLLARLATKCAKPNGQFHMENAFVEDYLSKLPIEELPGAICYDLKGFGIKTCGDLKSVPLSTLLDLAGNKHGKIFYELCRGVDNRPLIYEQTRKSVKVEWNYGIRFKECVEVEIFLRELCAEAHSRLQHIKRKTQCIALKLMVRSKDAPLETAKFMGHGVCDTFTKSIQFPYHTDDFEEIRRTVLTAMEFLNKSPQELRGIGIHLMELDGPIETPRLKESLKLSDGESGEQQQLQQSYQLLNNVGYENHNFKDVMTTIKSAIVPRLNNSFKKCDKNLILPNSPDKPKTLSSVDLPCSTDTGVSACVQQTILNNNTEENIILPYQLQEISPSPKHSPEKLISIERDDNTLSDLDMRPSTSRAALEGLKKRRMQNTQATFQENNSKINLSDPIISQDSNDTFEIEIVVEEKAPAIVTQSRAEKLPNLFLQPNRKNLLLQWIQRDYTPRMRDLVLCCKQVRAAMRKNYNHNVFETLGYMSDLLSSQRIFCGYYDWYEAFRIIWSVANEEVNLLDPDKSDESE